MTRDFLGVWIPKEIYLNEDLTPTEKLLLAEITSFANNGVCFASNEHFARFLGVSKKHISKLLTKLVRMSLVEIELFYKDGTKEVEKRTIIPIYIKRPAPTHSGVDPYTHESVDPHRIEEYTPTHSGVDPHRTEAYYKEQYKITNKEQEKEDKKINKKDSVSSSRLENEFESLWELYPRKIGKKKAFDAFKKARKVKKTSYEDIQNGLLLYLRHIEQNEIEDRFIQHGSTWFNQEKWQDEYTTVTTMKKPKNALEYFKRNYGGNNHEPNRNGEIIDHYSEVLPESLQGF